MSRLKLFFLQAAAGFLFWTAILTPYMLWVVDMTNVQYWKWVGMNLLFASILSPTSVWFINWFVGRFSGRAKEYLVTITARDPGLAAGFRSTDRYVMEADTPAAALRKARAEAPRHWEWFPNATLEIEVYDRVADERLERTAGAAGGR